MRATSLAVPERSLVCLRVLVAEAGGAVNEGLTTLLSDLEGITIFGCAQSPAKVLALVETVHPDVVILDLQLPGAVGLQMLKRLHHLRPAPVVAMLSPYDLPPLREACLAAGADCFLLTTAAIEPLRELLTGLVQARSQPGNPPAGTLKL